MEYDISERLETIAQVIRIHQKHKLSFSKIVISQPFANALAGANSVKPDEIVTLYGYPVEIMPGQNVDFIMVDKTPLTDFGIT